MPLLLALVLVIMFATADVAPWLVATSAGRFGAALLVMLVPTAFAWLSASSIARAVRRGRLDQHAAIRQLRWAMWLHLVVWCASVAVLAFVVGWSHLIRTDWGLDAWPLVDEWLMLVPIVVPIVCGWLAFYEVHRALESPQSGRGSQRSRWTYVGQRVRGELLLLLLPVVVIVTLADLAAWWEIPLEGGVASSVMGATAVVALALLYPWLLRACWRARRLPDGPVRDQLEAALARWNLGVSDIMIWPTDGRMANAAVAGLVPSLRYVFLTDALVRNFTAKELEAVLAHEMGHLRHRHLFLRLMAMFVPLAVWPLLWAAGMIADPVTGGTLAAATIGSDMGRIGGDVMVFGGELSAAAWLTAVAIGMLLIAYMATVWAGYSRLLEREADLFACACLPPTGAELAGGRSTGRNQGGPEQRGAERGGGDDRVERFVAVLEKLAVSNGIEINQHQWQHGSVQRRAEFLRRVGRDNARAGRYHARLARLAMVVVALGAIGALCCVV